MIKQEEVEGVWVLTLSGIGTPNDFDQLVPRMEEALSRANRFAWFSRDWNWKA